MTVFLIRSGHEVNEKGDLMLIKVGKHLNECNPSL